MQTARHRTPDGPWRAALSEVAAALLPVSCAGCGRPDAPCCRRCLTRVLGRAGPIEQVTGNARPIGLAGLELAELEVRSLSTYAGPVRNVVVAWKDRGRVDLTDLVAAGLARAAAEPLRRDPGTEVLLVPVPSSAAAVRRRGTDVMADAAERAAGRLRRRGLAATAVPALRQVGRLADQAGLSVSDRARNVEGHFAIRAGPGTRARRAADLAGRAVVVVDDVVTTGASSAEAVRVLQGAGAQVLMVASLAATVRRAGCTAQPDQTRGQTLSGEGLPTRTGED